MKVKVKGNDTRNHELTRALWWPMARLRHCVAAALFVFASSTAPALAIDIRGVTWDGSAFTGQWIGIKDQSLEFETKDGRSGLSLDDVASVDFPVPPRAPTGPVAFYLHDGGMMFGNLLGSEGESVRTQTAVHAIKFPWTQLAAIRLAEPTQFKRAAELFEEARSDRSPSQDRIVSRDHAEVRVLEGRLETLDESGGAFVFSGESRKFQNAKLFGIIFAAGAAKPNPRPVRVELADGSVIFAEIESADDAKLRVRVPFSSSALEVLLADVRRMSIRSPRVEFVSALKPSAQQTDGVLHAPSPVVVDRSVLGNPISMGGRTFERGLGTHSRSEVSYAVGGVFEQFAATIGIDDAVRPLGSVVMQVKGDGKTLFDSGAITGDMPPRDILVDVKGVQTLTLLVDYGEGLDASDHAGWGDARLLRPRGTKEKARTP